MKLVSRVLSVFGLAVAALSLTAQAQTYVSSAEQLQQAINDTSKPGGRVVLSSGFYPLDNIVWKRSTSLICNGSNASNAAGGGVELRQTAAGTSLGDFITTDPTIPSTDDQHWSMIEGCAVRANPGSTGTASGIVFNARSGELTKLHRLSIHQFPGDGIKVSHGSQPLYWEDLHFFLNGHCGLNLTKTGGDNWASANINFVSGDDNGTALVCMNLGSGSQTAGSPDGITINGIKAEADTAGRQQNVVTMANMNNTNVTINSVTAYGLVSANAVFQFTGTSVPRLIAHNISVDCSKYLYLIDDQVNGIQIPCQAAGSIDWKFPDRMVIDGVGYFRGTGTGTNLKTGFSTRRVTDTDDRVRMGDGINLCNGAGTCDSQLVWSAAGEVVFQDPTNGANLRNVRVGNIKIGSTGGTYILRHISATAALDWGAIPASSCDVSKTIAVTNAAGGDVVALGIPSALGAAVPNVTFSGYVSSAGVVTVKACNVATTASTDPASATVRADVWQH